METQSQLSPLSSARSAHTAVQTPVSTGVAIPFGRLADKSVRQRLHFYRLQRGISQTKLAQMTGYSQATISRIERNPEVATVGQFLKICDALKITVFDL